MSEPEDRFVLVERELIWVAIDAIERMENYLDGVITGAGDNAIIPKVMSEIEAIKSDLHNVVCDKCGNQKRQGRREARVLKIVEGNKPQQEDGGKPEGDRSI